MSNQGVTATGQVFKLEPNRNGFYKLNIKGDDGKWYNDISLGIKQPPNSFQNGARITITFDPNNYNNIIGVPQVLAAQSQGGQGKQGGGKFVDNSIGMGVGAALNNAVQLLIHGRITESQIPTVIANLYTLSESAKAAISANNIQQFVQATQFSLGVSQGQAAVQQSTPVQQAPQQQQQAPQQNNQPTYQQAMDTGNNAQGGQQGAPANTGYDDDIPF